MLRLRLAMIAIACAAFAGAPPVAAATVMQSTITSPANGSSLQSSDNPPASTVSVTGNAPGAIPVIDTVDIVCYYGAPPGSEYKVLASLVPVVSGDGFSASPPLRPIAGHACRLRAVPSGDETYGDVS